MFWKYIVKYLRYIGLVNGVSFKILHEVIVVTDCSRRVENSRSRRLPFEGLATALWEFRLAKA